MGPAFACIRENVEPADRIGSLLGGRYRVRQLLGSGGMSSVFLAEHEVLRRPFAVKVLRRELADDERVVQRFHREARAASRVEHPNIVYISDFGTTDDGSLFLVMEYIPGQSLRSELRRLQRLPLVRALKLLVQIADALDCAHRAEVVHRDLKPENLLLTEYRGKPDFVKILDFGIAKIVSPEETSAVAITAKGEVYGTPEYMAPEQFEAGAATPSVDIYALGVVAYEITTGDVPFLGSVYELLLAHGRQPPVPPSVRCPDLTPAFDAIIGKCLAKRPHHRYASAGDLRDALLRLWRLLTGRQPKREEEEELDATSVFARPAGFGPPGGADATVTRAAGPHHATPEASAELIDRLVRELAEALRDFGHGSAELSVVLTRALEAEERVLAEEAEIALAEALIAETDQTMDERESRLRQAVLQLRQERSRAAPANVEVASTLLPEEAVASSPTGEPDLEAHIAQLEQRMAALQREREERTSELRPRIAQHREALDQWRAHLRTQAQALVRLVDGARATVQTPEILRLYERLDQLRAPDQEI